MTAENKSIVEQREQTMKKTFLTILISLVLVGMLAGCAEKNQSGIDIMVDGYRYVYALSGVSTADNGNTTIKMVMKPQKNSDGETADILTAMNVAGMFLMETYIVCDSEEYEYNENSNFTIDNTENKEINYLYTYEFDTEKQPDSLFFYPANKRNEVAYHWQLDPTDGHILKAAAITIE
jgi:hypothetical protein